MEKETAPILVNSYTPILQPLPPASDPQIQGVRQRLIIILSVCLILSLLTVGGFSVNAGVNGDSMNTSEGIIFSISEYISLILVYGFGIFAAYRYSTLGLRIFAWLNIIGLVIIGFIMGAFVIAAFAGFSLMSQSKDLQSKHIFAFGSTFILILAAVCLIDMIVSILIVIYSFKLARLIDHNGHLFIQQI